MTFMQFISDAKWIWSPTPLPDTYNRAVVARRYFETDGAARALVAITADSWYRLFVNGNWIADGPARGWPRHYYYDVLDVTHALRSGRNKIEILARHFGTGDFHYVPVQPGLLAQIEIGSGPNCECLYTDANWDVADYIPVTSQSPRIALQMEPMEIIDARCEELRFLPARIVATLTGGGWQDLRPRDCALLTRQPRNARTLASARIVALPETNFLFPVQRLLYNNVVEIDSRLPKAAIAATILWLHAPGVVDARPINNFPDSAPRLFVDAKPADAPQALEAGEHLLMIMFEGWGHHNQDQGLILNCTAHYALQSPLEASASQPWAFARLRGTELDEQGWLKDVIPDSAQRSAREQAFKAHQQELCEQLALSPATAIASALRAALGDALKALPEGLPYHDPHTDFLERKPLGDVPFIINPTASLHDMAECATIHPSAAGDIELCYDLGEQTVGYYEIELDAAAGTFVDLFGIEYITPEGQLQPTWMNRNGMRYTCRAGRNHYISTKRRGGRYLFLTLRNQTAPVHLRLVRLIESTYPTSQVGTFQCSDAELNRIWQIALRTLELCMEDAFTDCPLYEQTLWVGDARNEGLYAMNVFGAEDLVRRCIRLAGDSLDTFPIVSPTAPTNSRQLLPAWSFLWGLAVWDYYWHTADLDLIDEVWPLVMRNLHGAMSLTDERGLFSGPFWNMFDWTPIDCGHDIVTHNSLLLLGSLQAARRLAEIKYPADLEWLQNSHSQLKLRVLKMWDAERGGYPDSIHNDGAISPSQSMHTSFLGLLFDVLPPGAETVALSNLLEPGPEVIRVGSPFAVQYLFEALDKMGRLEEILAIIRRDYAPMLRAGATTVWEQYAIGGFSVGEFPTRSHCHAWSSAPLYFFSRILLGIRATSAGGASFEISPWVTGVDWAHGTVAVHRGIVRVEWEKAENILHVRASAPDYIHLEFATNPSCAQMVVDWSRSVLI